MECGFSDIFSRHFCSTVAKTIGLTNYAASFGAKKCSENHIWSCWDNSRSTTIMHLQCGSRDWPFRSFISSQQIFGQPTSTHSFSFNFNSIFEKLFSFSCDSHNFFLHIAAELKSTRLSVLLSLRTLSFLKLPLRNVPAGSTMGTRGFLLQYKRKITRFRRPF